MASPLKSTEARRIAAFAIENNTLFSTLVSGIVEKSDTDGGYFRYREISEPTKTHLNPSLSEDEVLAFTSDFLKKHDGRVDAIGISTYGAIDTHSSTVEILSDNHPGGKAEKIEIGRALRRSFGNLPVVLDNDATAACVGESVWGAGRDIKQDADTTYAFIWVSRGVNAGFARNRQTLDVRFRPETGHLRAHRIGSDLSFEGACPKHKDRPCLTGLAGLTAVRARLASPDCDPSTADEIIDLTAGYISQLCAVVMMTMAPTQMAIGGLQMRGHYGDLLFERIRHHFPKDFHGVPLHAVEGGGHERIVQAQLGEYASLLGIAEIARRRIEPELRLAGINDA